LACAVLLASLPLAAQPVRAGALAGEPVAPLPAGAPPETTAAPRWGAPSTPRQLLPDETPQFVEAECPFVVPWSETITCGRLRVPENRRAPTSATIEVFVAILKSLGPATGDPVLVLPGGPGGGALASRHLLYPLRLRASRDLILIDPRGTGASTPSLDCFEVTGPTDVLATPATAASAARWSSCAARLQAEGRDLNGYVTAEQVEDIADLARVLQIRTLNLYATSYGTRVAVHLADRYPGLVRSMVLDGVLPIAANAMLEEPLHAWAVLRRVAADCAADAGCNSAFPALEARLLAVIDRYNRAPMPDDLGYGSGADILRLLVDHLHHGGARLPALITALYERDIAGACRLLPPDTGCFFAASSAGGDAGDAGAAGRLAPGALATVAPILFPLSPLALPSPQPTSWRDHFADPANPAGPHNEEITWLMQLLEAPTLDILFAKLDALEATAVSHLLAGFPRPPADSFSEGAFASVICSEEAPFYTIEDVAAVAARVPAQMGALPMERAALVAALCNAWPVAPVSPAAKVTDTSYTPTLLLAGTHDPVTPVAWARRAAATLEKSRLILFPGRGHALLTTDHACVDALLTRFFADPDTPSLPACLARLQIEWEGLSP
jgi:pimeloyl-ACP methyl ester carboxylesterase